MGSGGDGQGHKVENAQWSVLEEFRGVSWYSQLLSNQGFQIKEGFAKEEGEKGSHHTGSLIIYPASHKQGGTLGSMLLVHFIL